MCVMKSCWIACSLQQEYLTGTGYIDLFCTLSRHLGMSVGWGLGEWKGMKGAGVGKERWQLECLVSMQTHQNMPTLPVGEMTYFCHIESIFQDIISSCWKEKYIFHWISMLWSERIFDSFYRYHIDSSWLNMILQSCQYSMNIFNTFPSRTIGDTMVQCMISCDESVQLNSLYFGQHKYHFRWNPNFSNLSNQL